MASQISVERRENKKEILKTHASVLLHAQTCTSKEKGTCSIANCHEAKCRLSHVIACRKEANCTHRHCSTYKKILAHWKSCSRPDCYLCHEYRSDVTSNTDVTKRNNETLVSSTMEESDTPVTGQLLSGATLLQWDKMDNVITDIQMLNRKVLAQLNHHERQEKEKASFMQELKLSLHQLREHMQKKSDDLTKLTKDVSTLQDMLDDIVSLTQTCSVTKEDTKYRTTQFDSSRVSGDKKGGHEDDSDNNNSKDGVTALLNVSSEDQYLNNSEMDTQRVSAHQGRYGEDSNHQLADEILSSDVESDISLGDITSENLTDGDMSICSNTGRLDIDPSSSIIQDSHKLRNKPFSDSNNSNDGTMCSGSSSLRTERGDYDARNNESVHPSSQQTRDSSIRNANLSVTDKSGNGNLQLDTSVQYKLPPVQSTRPQGHTGKDRRLLRDSKGFKSKCTSATVDNRYKELEDVVCSNIPMATSKDKRGKRSSRKISTSSSKQNISKADTLSDIVKPNVSRLRQSDGHKSSFSDMATGMSEHHVDINTWRVLANAEANGGVRHELHIGKGPDTVLCLDISESMMGENFKSMISVVKAFIRGITRMATSKGIPENISIAVFGHETHVIRHLTDDYQVLLSDLDKLTAGGNTPMAGGLLMALAGSLTAGHTTTIHKFRVPARIILLTDGKAGDIETSRSDYQSSSMDDSMIKAGLIDVCEDLRKRRIKVYWVPIGRNTTSIFTDIITSTTKGKMIAATQPSEMNRLVEWTQTRCNAMDIALRYPDKGPLEQSMLQLLCASHGWTCNVDDLNDLIVECHESMHKEEDDDEDARHEECDPYMPMLGARVKRGPTWCWGNQDAGGFGTVIGHLRNGMMYVEWDSGIKNRYNYNHTAKDVEVTDAPRILKSDELIATGCLVKRGESWQSGDEDGGPGCVGSIYLVCRNGMVGVRWRKGKQGMYRYGCDGHFDLKICQSDQVVENRQQTEIREASERPYSTNVSRSEHISTPPSVEDMNRRNMMKNTECKAKWQYMKDDGIWTNYSVEQNSKLEKAFQRNKEGSPIAEVEGEIFQVSFTRMTQTHATSKQTMKIQRIDLSSF